MRMNRILLYFGHHGIWRTGHRVIHAACNRAFPYHTFAVMWMPALFIPGPTNSASGRFQIRRLSPDEAFNVSRLPGTGMPERYVEDALARGDECLGVMIHDEPACVSWYARRMPVALYRWWNVEFPSDYVYVHGAYTSPAHRGKRLLEQNLHAAVTLYASAGATDLFALVESSNYASLNAFRRAGYAHRATIRTAKVGGRFFARHDAESLNARVSVTPRANPEAAKPSGESVRDAA